MEIFSLSRLYDVDGEEPLKSLTTKFKIPRAIRKSDFLLLLCVVCVFSFFLLYPFQVSGQTAPPLIMAVIWPLTPHREVAKYKASVLWQMDHCSIPGCSQARLVTKAVEELSHS